MPHLFSGLNQKRQSGVITGGTSVVGSKGRGSSTRMVSHCKSIGTSHDCVAAVLNAVKPKSIETFVEIIPKNDLFNRKSFY
jgi:hypothetical protein